MFIVAWSSVDKSTGVKQYQWETGETEEEAVEILARAYEEAPEDAIYFFRDCQYVSMDDTSTFMKAYIQKTVE